MPPSNRKILVTGASGFIASHCIIQLLNKGYFVRGTVRDLQRAERIATIIKQHTTHINQLEFVQTDLLHSEGWETAIQGCQHVLHIASPLPIGPPKHPNDLIIPAREGTLRVLHLAAKYGIKRVVLTSSIAAACYGHKNTEHRIFTETDWTNINGKSVFPYILSKALAEQAAWQFMQTQSPPIELVTILPGYALGPALETDYGTSLELIRKLMRGDLFGCPKIGWPFVDVRDIAAMHIAALEIPEAKNQRFLLGNDFLWIKDIAIILRKHFPQYRRKIYTFELPDLLVRFAGLFDKAVRTVVGELNYKKQINCSKAKNILHWQPRSNEEAIVSAAESLIRLRIV